MLTFKPKNHVFLWFLLMIAFFVLGLHPNTLITPKNGETDDAAYLSHALTIGLDFDLNYENECSTNLNSHNTPVGPVGPGLLASPFVAIFATIDRLQNHPVITDHRNHLYSWSLYGFFFGAVFYFFMGLFLYENALNKLGVIISPGFNFLLVASSGVLFYVLGRFTMPHAFEFFSLSLVFWSFVMLWNNRIFDHKEYRLSAQNLLMLSLCGLGVSLNILVRPANINIILLPLLIIALLSMFESKKIDFTKLCILLFVAIIIFYIPVLCLNIALYGGLYDGSYAGSGSVMSRIPSFTSFHDIAKTSIELILLLPNIWKLLFSSEFGLIYSNPILVFGVASVIIIIITKARKRIGMGVFTMLLTLIYGGLPVAVVLFWKTTASSYGYRYLYSLYPLALIGYSLSILKHHRCACLNETKRRIAKAIHWVFICFCVFSILGQIFYGSSEKLKTSQKVNVFGVMHEASAQGYESALLREMFSPKAWILLISQRLPGYFALKILPAFTNDNEVYLEKVGLTKKLLTQKKEFINRILAAPSRVSVQLIILSLVWSLGCWIYLYGHRRKSRTL